MHGSPVRSRIAPGIVLKEEQSNKRYFMEKSAVYQREETLSYAVNNTDHDAEQETVDVTHWHIMHKDLAYFKDRSSLALTEQQTFKGL